jgi:NAD(P)-dependent dehydrogenase (short-subunit alcohol dehydrogenase family)
MVESGAMSLFDLTGKTALVTGGTRGIGLMIARGLLDAGARVAISSRKADACEEARAELESHGEVIAVPMDVSSEAGCQQLAQAVRDQWGTLNILVNNAGATWGEPLETFPESAWDKVLNLNLKSPFFLTRAVLPMLEQTATQDDPARIINIGSIDGLHVPRMQTYSYATSKAAIHQLTRVLARELGPRHITVNAVAPGPFESKMMAWTLQEFGDAIAASSPLGRIGRPDDMAGVAVFLCSRAGSYVTGAVIPVDGGIATTV